MSGQVDRPRFREPLAKYRSAGGCDRLLESAPQPGRNVVVVIALVRALVFELVRAIVHALVSQPKK